MVENRLFVGRFYLQFCKDLFVIQHLRDCHFKNFGFFRTQFDHPVSGRRLGTFQDMTVFCVESLFFGGWIGDPEFAIRFPFFPGDNAEEIHCRSIRPEIDQRKFFNADKSCPDLIPGGLYSSIIIFQIQVAPVAADPQTESLSGFQIFETELRQRKIQLKMPGIPGIFALEFFIQFPINKFSFFSYIIINLF